MHISGRLLMAVRATKPDDVALIDWVSTLMREGIAIARAGVTSPWRVTLHHGKRDIAIRKDALEDVRKFIRKAMPDATQFSSVNNLMLTALEARGVFA